MRSLETLCKGTSQSSPVGRNLNGSLRSISYHHLLSCCFEIWNYIVESTNCLVSISRALAFPFHRSICCQRRMFAPRIAKLSVGGRQHSTMSDNELVALNWRKAPSRLAIIDKIFRLLTDISMNSLTEASNHGFQAGTPSIPKQDTRPVLPALDLTNNLMVT